MLVATGTFYDGDFKLRIINYVMTPAKFQIKFFIQCQNEKIEHSVINKSKVMITELAPLVEKLIKDSIMEITEPPIKTSITIIKLR